LRERKKEQQHRPFLFFLHKLSREERNTKTCQEERMFLEEKMATNQGFRQKPKWNEMKREIEDLLLPTNNINSNWIHDQREMRDFSPIYHQEEQHLSLILLPLPC